MTLNRADFARLSGAILVAGIGALCALILAAVFFPPLSGGYESDATGVLEWAERWAREESREMAFFWLTLLLGTAGAILGAWWRRKAAHQYLLLSLTPILLVPLYNAAIAAVFTEAPSVMPIGIAAAATVGLGVLMLAAERFLPPSTAESVVLAVSVPDGGLSWPLTGRQWLVFAVTLAIIAVLLIPASPQQVAQSIGYDMHMASFMTGPASYRFTPGLVPGVDYFTQYSVGTPWLFSWFLAPTAAASMTNAVLLVVAEMTLFLVTLFVFLWWFLRSWRWALALTVAVLITQFVTSEPLYAPSSTAARYPLLMLVALLFVWWVRHDLAIRPLIALSIALALSLFLNTETGVYACLAVAVATFVAVPRITRVLTRGALLAAVALVAFIAASVIAFGPGVITIQYAAGLLQPLMLYSGGLGAAPTQWEGGWHLFYNIVCPGLAIASIGWAAVTARTSDPAVRRDYLAGLAFVAAIAPLMSTKFINQSLVAVWQVNSFAFLVVLGWWTRGVVSLASRHAWPGLPPLALRLVVGAIPLAFLVYWLIDIDDPRNPSLYAIDAYRSYPSVVNSALGVPEYPCLPGRTGCLLKEIAPEDADLIRRLTKPGERVMLFSLADWAYLIEAQRASHFFFLPSRVLFTKEQLEKSMEGIDQVDAIFLPNVATEDLGLEHGDVRALLEPILQTQFRRGESGIALVAWQRVK